MNKKKIEEIMELVEKSETVIIATEKGGSVCGTGPQLLANLTCLIRSLRTEDEISDCLLEEAFKLSFLTDKELKEEVIELIDEMLKDCSKSKEAIKEINDLFEKLFER